MGRAIGASAGEIRTNAFRHTYCAARLQTLDQGAPAVTENVTEGRGVRGKQAPHDHASDGGAATSDEWAWVELNYRPHAYQACALTT